MGSPSRKARRRFRQSCLPDNQRDRVGDAAPTPLDGRRARAYLAVRRRFRRQFGDHLVAVLEDPRYGSGTAFGLKGDTGITVLEGEAA